MLTPPPTHIYTPRLGGAWPQRPFVGNVWCIILPVRLGEFVKVAIAIRASCKSHVCDLHSRIAFPRPNLVYTRRTAGLRASFLSPNIFPGAGDLCCFVLPTEVRNLNPRLTPIRRWFEMTSDPTPQVDPTSVVKIYSFLYNGKKWSLNLPNAQKKYPFLQK